MPTWRPPGASPPPGRSAGGVGSPGRCSGFRESSPCSVDRCASCPRSPSGWRRSCAAEALGLAFGAAFALVAELDLAAHARAGRDREGAGFDIAVDHARLEQLDPLGILDVADELASHAHHARLHLPFEARAGFEADVTIDLHVAFEAT